MKNTHYNIFTITLIAVLAAFTSCQRSELCYNHFPTADLSLAWELEWERDYGSHLANDWDETLHGFSYDDLRPGLPEWVNMVTYDEAGNPDTQFLTPQGGNLVLETGNKKKSVLLYNGDTEYIVLTDIASLPEARASATPRSRASITSVMERHPESRSTSEPDMLYSAYIENLPEIQSHETKQVPVKMHPLVFTYVIRYEFEYGQESISLARGVLGGMAESIYLRDGSTSDDTSLVLFDCEVKDYGCEAHVRTFGTPGFKDDHYGRSGVVTAADRPYTLNLEVMLKNGNIVEYNYDIADQIKHQPRGGVIKVSGLRVEDKDSMQESGFDVEVTDWGEHEDIDLPVGVDPAEADDEEE